MALQLNYVADLEDEVALEGLDGITLEALWLRLKHRPNFEGNMPLDGYSKEFLWSLIRRNEEITMYELPQPRGKLVIFNRYENMDQELGIILEPKELPPDIYPFCPIDDTENGVRGSCNTYYERQDVTQKASTMSLKQVEKMYGEKLVIVASQLLRNKSLCITSCIDKFYDLTINQYMILERIGRSRRMGEITQGKGSLASMGENPKTMFYHRKRLLKMNLITKQHHQQKGIKGQPHNGSLLHLTRFYVERRSKFIMMIQRAVVMLKNRPDHCAPYAVVKEEMGLPEPSCRKLFKSTEFQRFIRNMNKPYRKVYPNASTNQWKCKGSNMERMVRIMELINPDIDPVEMFKGDEAVEEEEEDEGYPGILNQSEIKWREDLLSQAYRIVEDAGPDGVTQSDIAQRLGQTKLDSRTICRNLQRCNTVHSLMKDIGRQRVSRYVSNKFLKTGHLTQEFRKERQKMMDMIEQDKPEEGTRPAISGKIEVMKTMESSLLEGVEVNMELITSKKEDQGDGEDAAAAAAPAVTVTDAAAADGDGDGGGGGDSGGGVVSSSSSSYLSSSIKTHSTPSSTQGESSSSSVKESNKDGFLSLVKEIKLSYNNQRRNSPHVTTRMMKRANMIIQTVRNERIIDDSFRLQKMIVEAESKEGYAVRMDKKSLNRLLDKLAKGGFLKNIIVKLKSKTKKRVKQVRYVVHPSITFDNPHLISTIEQLKVKFMVGVTDPKKEVEGDGASKKDGKRVKKENRDESVPAEGDVAEEGRGDVNTSVRESMDQLKLMHNVQENKTEESDENFKKLVSVKGTLGPKFMRMCELHKLLFYIVYGYEGQEDLCQEDAWVTIASTSPEINLQNEDITEYPQIYLPELSWKMFIPPLQKHRYNSERGWAFVCDVLLRLPLCIFVRFISLSYTSQELDSFLNHPLKKNLLVKNLPPHLRLSLLHGRRYVTYVMELINRLCYIGLLQYGQQVLKEKDQVFIYVNRNATLMDTTISSPGYHQVSADKEYMRKEYHFTNLQDILQYWYDLWSISMNTPLGGHNFLQGKKVTIQILDRKPQMLESLLPRNTWEAPLRDVGNIPGDGRGASGLDSAMFAHLKRNWSSPSGHGIASRPSAILSNPSISGEKGSYEGSASYSKYLMNTTNPSLDTQSPKHRLAGLRNVKLYRAKLGPDGKEIEVPVKLVSRHPRGKKRSEETSQPSPSDAQQNRANRKRGRANPKSYQRELKQRKKCPKKPYYDEEDRAALRRMNKLRVDWTSAEDSFLLLCKVASCFLFPNVRSQMITFSLVRDLMHERFPEARNKTSRACQRRINYIMKNATTEDNVSIFLEEVRQDQSIVEDFKSPKIPRNRDNIANVYTKIFRELMSRLVVKFASNDSWQCPDLPKTMKEFEQRYQVVVASSSLRNKLHIKEVTTLTDIDFHVVNSLIYSSLCSKFDRESYAYQLYLAYQQYPQTLLHAVLTRMRQDQMISYKKCYNRSSVALTCLPLSTSPFQLSVTFQYLFNFKYQYEVFGEAWKMLKQLKEKNNEIINKAKTSQPSTSSPDATVESCSHGPPENGVPMMINNEGGYCAAIVALMATKRLIFDIVIPEQIIMMDQQHSLLQDHHQSLLQRFSDHTELSGRDIQELEPPPFTQPHKKHQKTTHKPHVAQSKGTEEDEVSSEANEKATEPKESLKRKNQEKGSARSPKKVCRGTAATAAAATKNAANVSQEGEQPVNEGGGETATSLTTNTTTTTTTMNPSQEEQRNESGQTTPPLTTTTTTTTTTSSDHHPTKRETLEETDDSMEGMSSQKKNQPVSKEEKKVTFQECGGGVQSETSVPDEDGTESQTRNVTSASRLGLYMMRDHLTLADVDQINLQHAQEHMVVNACEIMCSLRPPPHLKEEYMSAIHEDVEAVNDILMPLSRGDLANALEYRKRVTLDVWNKLDDVVARWEEERQSPDLVAMVKEVYEYISECKEIGASVKDLKEKYRNYPYSITAITALMEETHLVIRVGAAVVRWVSVHHCKPWFIHTAKITKVNRQSVRIQGVYRMNLDESDKSNKSVDLRDKTSRSQHSQLLEESVQQDGTTLPPVDSSSSGSQKETETTEEPSSSDTGQQIIPDTDDPLTSLEEEAHTSSSTTTHITTRRSARISHNATAGDEDKEKGGESAGKRHIHSFLVMRKRNYKRDEEVSISMEKTIKHHRQKSDHEKLDVAMRPWVKLNGTLNRRVLDRFLGAVLSLVMERPGITGRDVVCRFSPALQPAHTHDLLETLVHLQCLQRIQLVPSHKPSLFSDIVDYSLSLAEVHDCDDDILYEPTVDAILKLSMFIGDKKYSTDFLMGDRR